MSPNFGLGGLSFSARSEGKYCPEIVCRAENDWTTSGREAGRFSAGKAPAGTSGSFHALRLWVRKGMHRYPMITGCQELC